MGLGAMRTDGLAKSLAKRFRIAYVEYRCGYQTTDRVRSLPDFPNDITSRTHRALL